MNRIQYYHFKVIFYLQPEVCFYQRMSVVDIYCVYFCCVEAKYFVFLEEINQHSFSSTE